MAISSTLRASVLPVTVRNTFIEDLSDRVSPLPAARRSSMPPSLSRVSPSTPAEGSGGPGIDNSWHSETEDDTEDRTTDVTDSRGAEESGRDTNGGECRSWSRSFPDTEDEWEVGSQRQSSAGTGPVSFPPWCAPAVPTPSPDVPRRHDAVEPGMRFAQAPRSRRCRRCRGRMGDRCPCIARLDASAESSGDSQKPLASLLLPQSHAHAITVSCVPAVARGARGVLAETTLKVFCADGGGGIAVERTVKKIRLGTQSAPPSADRGAGGPTAPQAAGRTRLSSKTSACQSAGGGAAAAPTPTEPTSATSQREEAPAPSPPRGVPKFGFALLQYVKGALQKNAFVAGVTISASAAGGWCVQLDTHRRDVYLRDHVLACAQEALFDTLDELEALRARASGIFPETTFDLKVKCSGSS